MRLESAVFIVFVEDGSNLRTQWRVSCRRRLMFDGEFGLSQLEILMSGEEIDELALME